MKIKYIAKILLMISFLIILGTKVYATTGTILEEAVKLRKQPDSKTVLDLLDKGTEVEILEQEDGWYKVKATTGLGKVTGYVSENEIKTEPEQNETEKPKTNETISSKVEEEQKPETNETISPEVEVQNPEPIKNIEENNQYTIEQEISIKTLPLINSREKAKIKGNIKVIEIINDWAKIENDTESGWIRKNILKNSTIKTEAENPELEEQPIETLPEETTPKEEVPEEETSNEPEENQEPETKEINKIGYISAEGLKVRKGPSTDTEEIDSLSKNDKVEIIGQTGNWYKINLDGEIGYVSAKYISDTKLPETTSRSGSTLRDEAIYESQEETKEENELKTEVEEIPEQSTQAESGTKGAEVVEYAKKYLGYKYVTGGTSPSAGFDCSGFTQYVFKHFGVSLNRRSEAQKSNGVSVEKSNLQLGDIVLFNNDANTKIGHVGIYVGDGNFIHASNPQDGVKITTLTSGYYHKRYVGARRVI